jgi:hypothetical protein
MPIPIASGSGNSAAKSSFKRSNLLHHLARATQRAVRSVVGPVLQPEQRHQSIPVKLE